MAAQAHADGMEITGFGNDRDCATASGGGLLIDFFDQPALNQLTGNFRDAGGGKLALFRNLNTGDGTVLINKAINRRAVQLFNEINITNLSLSA
jgi:hypothetical protein